jgi:ABC-type lipoprotein release transport system permease subunit
MNWIAEVAAANLFPVIGIAPMIGVNFTAEQEVSDDAVMLSYGFWKERLGGSPDALGTRLTIGGKTRSVILACVVPARRAATIDAIAALRH